MDIEAALEPACGYIQDQEMVDRDDADYHVGSFRPAHIQHPSSFQGSHRRNEHAYINVHLHIDPVRDNRLCLGNP